MSDTTDVVTCVSCGYAMTGLESARCPECGYEPDAEEIAFAERRRFFMDATRWSQASWVVLAVMFIAMSDLALEMASLRWAGSFGMLPGVLSRAFVLVPLFLYLLPSLAFSWLIAPRKVPKVSA